MWIAVAIAIAGVVGWFSSLALGGWSFAVWLPCCILLGVMGAKAEDHG